MLADDRIWAAQGDSPRCPPFGQAARHGLAAGASGTDKMATPKVMAEGPSQAGVPVWDVLGDAGLPVRIAISGMGPLLSQGRGRVPRHAESLGRSR